MSRDKILVVDDDESMRDAIEGLMDAAGLDTIVYSSAEDLLASGALEQASCVITDLKLPQMQGLELLTHLRGRSPEPPVIVITAHDMPGLGEQALQLGAAAYFPKPFAGTALLAAIKRVTAAHPH
jgi:FixJ family two-component response regulator